ncbi:DUF6705 family protein [Flavobacterium sp. CS20]|uniref:DUF6705 family protein n=1 Tax=Flavobacterium sp. CS20 TaxID=2775246 RepID=UPI001B3A6519|nr:DUF6705 family protein [Flavobacterium sp. CS20]QTY25932.1 hypothetical protein IGB25_07830 [Flavobacterium sp. CS20]
MKKIILNIFFIFVTLNIFSQNINDPFVGTWEWENNNQIFRVILYLDEDEDIRGDFEMVEVLGNNLESLIYESNKDNGFGYKYGPVIFGGSDGTELGATFTDNTVTHPYGQLSGELKMVIQLSNTPGLTTATWQVRRTRGLKRADDDRTFNIPTNIILTKVD